MPAKENNKDSQMAGRWREDIKKYDFCLESAYYSKAHISQNSQ